MTMCGGYIWRFDWCIWIFSVNTHEEQILQVEVWRLLSDLKFNSKWIPCLWIDWVVLLCSSHTSFSLSSSSLCNQWFQIGILLYRLWWFVYEGLMLQPLYSINVKLPCRMCSFHKIFMIKLVQHISIKVSHIDSWDLWSIIGAFIENFKVKQRKPMKSINFNEIQWKINEIEIFLIQAVSSPVIFPLDWKYFEINTWLNRFEKLKCFIAPKLGNCSKATLVQIYKQHFRALFQFLRAMGEALGILALT